jgi:uncharacterized protein
MPTRFLTVLLAVVLLALPGRGEAQDAEQRRTIQVNASGEVRVAPDLAHLTFAVETEAATAREAGEENARRMDAVVRALVDAGVPRRSIETRGYTVHPEYTRPDRAGDQPRIRGYRAVNRVALETEELRAVGAYIDRALGAGANRMESLHFSISDDHAAHIEALRRATERARSSASAIATSLGVTLGAPVTVSTDYHRPSPHPGVRMEAMIADAPAAPPTPVEPTTQTVTASVHISFELIP